jgi:hypothetical protein
VTRRDGLLLGTIVLVLLGAVAYAGFRAREWWLYRGEVAVDWHPDPIDPVRSYERYPTSPDDALAAVLTDDGTVVVDEESGDAVADLGDVASVMWVSDDVLVAFGGELMGPHEGMAVIDFDDRSIDQVDDLAGTNREVHPVRLTRDGRLVACEWHDAGSDQWCEAERYLLDPEKAELRLAPWGARQHPPEEYD